MYSNTHLIHFLLVIVLAFTVLTTYALTLFRTLQTRAETLTILFLALRFFARAFSHRNEGRNVLEKARIAVVSYLFGLVDLFVILRFVPATYTDTVFVACPSSGETFTIKFETINFGAFTALSMAFVLGLDGSGLGVVKTVKRTGGGPSFIKETFKEVTSAVVLVDHGFNIIGVEELGLHKEYRIWRIGV